MTPRGTLLQELRLGGPRPMRTMNVMTCSLVDLMAKPQISQRLGEWRLTRRLSGPLRLGVA
jgi:hypothetical protein